jgi:signal transduction histidine kinase
LQATSPEEQSAEIELPDGRIYLATASTIEVDGRPAGRVCILRDVTHFKELDALKSDFVATVSHDLRSPLSLMRGYTSMLGTVGELNDQQREYVNKIIVGVENMSHLVNNLLDLGRIEAGVGLTVEHVGVLDVLQRVTGALQHRAIEKDITLTIEMPKDMPHAVEADGALLDQALYNLVENAIKYTPQGGNVRVTTHSTSESVTFEIIDSGVGIAPEHAARLFEKFYRSPQRETRAEYGTGLGLAIVRSIAGRHAGQVWVESQLGKGSHFFLKVPLSHPQAGTAA